MKQVIFICLLSISLCLSAPPNQTPVEPKKHEGAQIPTGQNAPPPIPPAQGAKVTPVPESHTPSDPPTTPNKTNESTTKDKDNVITTQITPVTEKNNTITEIATPTPSPANKPTTTTTTVPTPVISTTKSTPTPEPEHKATVPPKTPEPVTVQARGFDGASFVGGIILTLGLLAIGFMGFKYYKNQTERNYHTL